MSYFTHVHSESRHVNEHACYRKCCEDSESELLARKQVKDHIRILILAIVTIILKNR